MSKTSCRVLGGSAARPQPACASSSTDRVSMAYSFQSPIEVPGVSNIDFLRMACNARRKQLGKEDFPPLEFYAFLAPKV